MVIHGYYKLKKARVDEQLQIVPVDIQGQQLAVANNNVLAKNSGVRAAAAL